MNYLYLGLVCLLGYLITSTFLSWYRLRHFKGPFLGAISYIWMGRTALSGKSYKLHMELKERYGEPLIRIGPDVLITDDAEIVRKMNAARSLYKRDKWYTSFRTDPYVHSMISTDDDDYHNDVKSKTAAAYSGKDVPTIESDIDGQIVSFKNLIRRNYISNGKTTKPMDLSKIQYFTLDVITKVGYGEEWGFMNTDSDINSFIQTFADISAFLIFCCDIPLARNIFYSNFFLNAFGPKETDKTGMGYMMGFVLFNPNPVFFLVRYSLLLLTFASA
jgi:hypothetical protein